MATLRTRIVRIGNSQGARIPKALLEQAKIRDWVELEVLDGRVVVRPARPARAGWAEQFAAMHKAGDDALTNSTPPAASIWDEAEWEW